MAALKLATMQAALVAYITTAQASPAIYPGTVLDGIPVAVSKFGEELADDVVTRALSEGGPGLCILSVPPFLARKEAAGLDLSTITVQLLIFLVENPTVNLYAEKGGLVRDPLEVVEALWIAMVGKPRGPQGFQLGASPMDLISESAAMRIYPIEVQSQLTFNA